MKRYFADTSFYIAALVPADEVHSRATDIARSDATIVTTAYVLLEGSAYFAKPPHRANWVKFVQRLRQSTNLTILPADPALFDRGWDLYSRHLDKDWSLVDCISFVVMRDLRIDDALATDHHFEQAGFQILLGELPT